MTHLVTALILSWLDYCNLVLSDLPASTIAPLQRVQNTAARLFLGPDRRSHITPALPKLHWFRITFYSHHDALMHHVFHQCCPLYPCSLDTFTAADRGQSRPRSSFSRAAITVRTRTIYTGTPCVFRLEQSAG